MSRSEKIFASEFQGEGLQHEIRELSAAGAVACAAYEAKHGGSACRVDTDGRRFVLVLAEGDGSPLAAGTAARWTTRTAAQYLMRRREAPRGVDDFVHYLSLRREELRTELAQVKGGAASCVVTGVIYDLSAHKAWVYQVGARPSLLLLREDAGGLRAELVPGNQALLTTEPQEDEAQATFAEFNDVAGVCLASPELVGAGTIEQLYPLVTKAAFASATLALPNDTCVVAVVPDASWGLLLGVSKPAPRGQVAPRTGSERPGREVPASAPTPKVVEITGAHTKLPASRVVPTTGHGTQQARDSSVRRGLSREQSAPDGRRSPAPDRKPRRNAFRGSDERPEQNQGDGDGTESREPEVVPEPPTELEAEGTPTGDGREEGRAAVRDTPNSHVLWVLGGLVVILAVVAVGVRIYLMRGRPPVQGRPEFDETLDAGAAGAVVVTATDGGAPVDARARTPDPPPCYAGTWVGTLSQCPMTIEISRGRSSRCGRVRSECNVGGQYLDLVNCRHRNDVLRARVSIQNLVRQLRQVMPDGGITCDDQIAVRCQGGRRVLVSGGIDCGESEFNAPPTRFHRP